MVAAKTLIDELAAARRDGRPHTLAGDDLDAVVAMLRHAAAPAPAIVDDPATTTLDTLVTAEGLDISVKIPPSRIAALVGVLQVAETMVDVLDRQSAEHSLAREVVFERLDAGRTAGLYR